MNDKALATVEDTQASALEKAALVGDLAQLQPIERLRYYHAFCESVGLNPLTRPLQYITLNGKLTLYARKEATDQLRSLRGISITSCERDTSDANYAVWIVSGRDKTGRTDMDIDSVPIAKLIGDARSNAIMKALTKAKRRMTLSLAGLGMLDETELDGTESKAVDIDPYTGEVATPDELELTRAQALLVERAKGVQDAPGQPEPIEVDEVPVLVDVPTQGGDDAMDEYEAANCGNLPDPNPLGITEPCVKPRDHKGVHGSPDGTWPA